MTELDERRQRDPDGLRAETLSMLEAISKAGAEKAAQARLARTTVMADAGRVLPLADSPSPSPGPRAVLP